MAGLPGALLLAYLVTAAPVCGEGPAEPLRRAVAAELNLARLAAGRRPLAPHPLLCELARERAAAIAATGELSADRDYVEATTRRFYRGGYKPHFWSDSALVGSSLSGVLGQLATIRPRWVSEAIEGEFDHLGVGIATLDGQPVVAFMLALHKCTFERRRAEELTDLEAVRAAALGRVNALRGEHGRPPVGRDERLDAVAQGHAEDLLRRSYYAHRSPEGVTPAGRVRGAGLAPRLVAENIAKGLFTPAEAVDGWMASPDHRENLLQPRATDIGLGVAVGPGREEECFDVYWVQLFAG